MQQTQDPKKVITGVCRLSYVHLITPRSTVAGGTPKFSVTLLIPKSDYATKQRIDAAIVATIQEGVQSKWNGQRPAQPALPIYDGDGLRSTGEPFGPECRGHWVMTASSEVKPQVVDANVMPILDQTQIYSGMYGRASIRFFAYFNSGKKGIGCGLNHVQKTADGEPLSSVSRPEDDFSAPWDTHTAPAQRPAYPAQQPGGYQAAPAPAPVYPTPQQPTYSVQSSAYPTPQQPTYPAQQPQYAAPAPQQPYTGVDPFTGQPLNILGIQQ